MGVRNYYPWTYWQQHIFRIIHRIFRPFPQLSPQLSWIHFKQNVNTSEKLFDISLKAIANTKTIDLSELEKRQPKGKEWIGIYPGEHYKLLAALMLELKPKTVIEIGTYLGHASIVLKNYIPTDSTLYTFDVFRWNEFDDTCLKESDFDFQLIQYTHDLTKFKCIEKHKDIIRSADFIFMDALKDGIQEKKFLENFRKIGLKDGALLFFDDIRVWNMIKVWHEIDMPKIDLTSYGHWSGSGLVEWKN